MSSLETDFNSPPYFNTHDPDDKYHRVLFKPGVALQSRELLETQDILQDQVTSFADHIFKDGAIVRGCDFRIDVSTTYLKFPDLNNDGQEFNVSSVTVPGTVVYNPLTGVQASVIDGIEGLESQNPDLKTLYVKYIAGSAKAGSGTSEFAPEDVVYLINSEAETLTINVASTSTVSALTESIKVYQKTTGASATVTVTNSTALSFSSMQGLFAKGYDLKFSNTDGTSAVSILGSAYTIDDTYLLETVTIASNSTFGDASDTNKNTIGRGARAVVTSGVLYQKGHFTNFSEQSVVTEKYDTFIQDSHIGFHATESIVNSSIDATLLDSASGFSNENAPGADRLKLEPTLVSINAATAAANADFFPVAIYSNGFNQYFNGESPYAKLASAFARRTFDESGNYVVDDFILSTSAFSNTEFPNDYNLLTIGPGTAYIKGYRFESKDNRFSIIRKGTDTANLNNQSVFTNYEFPLHVNDASGNFSFTQAQTINLHDTDPNFLTNDSSGNYEDGISTATISGEIIGTARIRSIEKLSGTLGSPNGTYKIYIFFLSLNEGKTLADVAAVSQGSSGSYTAVGTVVPDSNGNRIRGSSFTPLIFDTGLQGVKQITDSSSIVRSTDTMDISGTQGSVTIANSDIFPYGIGDPTPARNEFLVIPQTSFHTGNVGGGATTGNVTTVASNSTVTGSGTSFTSTLNVGQYIHLSGDGQIVRVDQINSDTEIEVSPAVNATDATGNRIAKYAFPADIAIDLEQQSNVVDLDIGTGSTVATFTFDAAANTVTTCDVTFNKKVTGATARSKTFQSTGDRTSWVYFDISTTALKAGPWCLSVADVFSIEKVYGSSSGTSISGATDITSSFELDNGQRRHFYGLSQIFRKRGATVDLSSYDYLIVQMKYFEHGAGDFFSVDSYPTSNASPTPADSIAYQQIPIFIPGGESEGLNLRNCIDFRPVVQNNVTPGGTVGAAVEAGDATVSFGSSDLKFPAPNERFDYDVEYYLPRKDVLIFNDLGQQQILEGRPAIDPYPPKPKPGMLNMATIDVPVFPSLDAQTAQDSERLDLMMTILTNQPKNYTMEEIGKIENRVRALEYESSLNTLERRSRGAFLPSEVDPTVERLKTSINVDEFDNLLQTDINNPETKIIPGRPRRSSISPPTTHDIIQLVANTEATANTVSLKDIITIDYEHEEWIKQVYASRGRRILQDAYDGVGAVTIFPAYDSYYDTKSNALDLGKTGIDIPPQSKLLIGTSDRADYLNESIDEFVTINGDDVDIKKNRIAVGDFIRDFRVTPFMRSRQVMLLAVGLQPGGYHRVYMGETDVTQHCVPVTMEGAAAGKYLNNTTKDDFLTETWNKNPEKFFGRGTRGTFQNTLDLGSGNVRPAGFKADRDGNVLVNYEIPSRTFLVGSHRITISQAATFADINRDADAYAVGTYAAYNYAVVTGTYVKPPPPPPRKASKRSQRSDIGGSDGGPNNQNSCTDTSAISSKTFSGARPTAPSPTNRSTSSCGPPSKIICSALYRLGHMPYAVFEADQLYGRKLREEMPEVNDGYRKWAQVVVDWMDGKGPSFMPWIQDDQVRAQKQSDLTIKVTKAIATPWAIQMAHEMGVLEKGSFTGKLLMTLGYPISKLVHKTKRKGTQFDYYLLAGFCMALYGISSVLKPLEGIKDFDDLSEEDLMNAERKLRSL